MNSRHRLGPAPGPSVRPAGRAALGRWPRPSLAGPGAQAATSEGLLCETDPHHTFSLTARDGYVSTPDGNSHLHVELRHELAGSFQLPARRCA